MVVSPIAEKELAHVAKPARLSASFSDKSSFVLIRDL